MLILQKNWKKTLRVLEYFFYNLILSADLSMIFIYLPVFNAICTVYEDECSKCGEIKKITIFSKHADGISLVKFATTYAAQKCIDVTNGRYFAGRHLKSFFWDGVTNYAESTPMQQEAEEQEEMRALDEFGDWLDNEEEDIPDELKLRVEE